MEQRESAILNCKMIGCRGILQAPAGVFGAASLRFPTPPILAQSNKPIRTGATHDLTGALSMDGSWNDRAVKAALAKIIDEGGIAGRV